MSVERSGRQENYKVRSILLSCAVLALIALPCTATENRDTCPERESTPEALSKQLEEGNASFETGDTTRAEAVWSEIRQCAPGSSEWPKAVFNLGLLEYRRSNFAQAISYFEAVLQSYPNDKEPGGNLMETNRNYSNRSAMAILQCYEQ